MPYLNWKTSAVAKRVDARDAEGRDFVLELGLGREAAGELASALAETFTEGQGELRLDLPDEWKIFWKWRDGESRLLLAHPQTDEWVATVALDSAHGVGLLTGLNDLASGTTQRLSLRELGPVGSVSNVEVVITVQ